MTPRSLPAAAWTALILFATLVPHSWLVSEGPAGEPSWLGRLLADLPVDKVVHATLFAGFGVLWRWARATPRQVFFGGLGLALLTEALQSIPALERSTDLADLVADLLGLGLALLVCRPRRPRVAEPEHAAAPGRT